MSLEHITYILLSDGIFGFALSDLVKDEYNKIIEDKKNKMLLSNDDIDFKTEKENSYKVRMNKDIIDIVMKLGKKASGRNCYIFVDYFNSELKNYIKIHNYDGYETLSFNRS